MLKFNAFLKENNADFYPKEKKNRKFLIKYWSYKFFRKNHVTGTGNDV